MSAWIEIFLVGDIIFLRGKGFISKAIQHFDGYWSHMAIGISENTHILESQYFSNVNIVKLDMSKYEDYEVVDLNLTKEQREQILKLGIQAIDNFGYDYELILWYLLEEVFKFDKRFIVNHPNNLICSELITYLLLQINWINDQKEINQVLNATPNEIYSFLKNKIQIK